MFFTFIDFFSLDVSIIIAGDFRQLPPVAARSLYSEPINPSQTHGHALYELFQTVVILKKNIRQQNAEKDFREGTY